MTYAPIETPPQRVAFSSKTAQSNVDKFSTSAFRVTRKEGSKDVEIKGVACSIRGTGYSARVITPALVELPTYRGKTDPIQVSCSASGISVAETVQPYNETLARIRSSQSTSGGLIGVLAVAAVQGVMQAARDPSKDQFAYRNPIVVKLGK
ncbi:hypothetical protein [Arenibacterium sp. CAU 1754]